MSSERDRSVQLPSVRDTNRRTGTLVVGRFKEHGAANYQLRHNQEPSYYLKVLTNRGLRTLWGIDLKRALEAAVTQPKIGDIIGAQRIAREAVTVTDRRRDAEGRVVSQTEHHAHRNRWRVEKVQFFAERAKLARRVRDAQADARDAVREHPELRSTFLTVRAAEEFAARSIRDPKERERFLEMVRGAMAGSIKKGEPLPEVRLRERSTRAPSEKSPQPSPKRDDGPAR